MPLPRDKAWFAAKSYGWGWGLPLRWQGWLVMAAFVAVLVGGAPLVKKGAVLYAIYSIAAAIALVGICYWKGEKPEWRGGPRQ